MGSGFDGVTARLQQRDLPSQGALGARRLPLALNAAKQLPRHAGASTFSAGGHTVGAMEKATLK